MMDLTMPERLAKVTEIIKESAQKRGRDPSEIILTAVSKKVTEVQVKEAADWGCIHFGENRVQELCRKMDCFSGDTRLKWHQIGRLQTNKVKYLIGKNVLIHSLDRPELAETVSALSLKAGVTTEMLLQVNVSREESKAGVTAEEVDGFIENISGLGGIKLKGLMTIAPHTRDKSLIRDVFSQLNNIFVDISTGNKYNENISMEYLSMGMSNDYDIAVEEGSNLVRIGTAVFGDGMLM